MPPPPVARQRGPLKIAVLLSGGGRTLQNLADRIGRGELDAKIVVAWSWTSKALGVERAKKLGIPVHVVEKKSFSGHNPPAEFSKKIWEVVREAGAELVCLAGFLSLLEIADDYVGWVINVHPALLP